MDIYVNGFLKRTYTFDSLPKQNYRKVWINRNGDLKVTFHHLYITDMHLTILMFKIL